MRFSRNVLPAMLLALVIVGCDSGCATSKPFAAGISTGVPLMDRDLRHFAAADPLRRADAEALRVAARRDPPNLAEVARSWASVKVWYLPSIDTIADPDARAIRRSAADRLDKLIADVLDFDDI